MIGTAVFRRGSLGAYVLLACVCLAAVSPAALAADKPKGQEISRVIAKEIDRGAESHAGQSMVRSAEEPGSGRNQIPADDVR